MSDERDAGAALERAGVPVSELGRTLRAILDRPHEARPSIADTLDRVMVDIEAQLDRALALPDVTRDAVIERLIERVAKRLSPDRITNVDQFTARYFPTYHAEREQWKAEGKCVECGRPVHQEWT